MDDFFKVYTKAQQFLLLQAYGDEVMTEAELMQFLMEETSDHRFLFVSNQQVYVVTPHVSLNDFTRDVFLPAEVQVQQSGNDIRVSLPTETLQLILGSAEEAASVASDFNYLLNQKS